MASVDGYTRGSLRRKMLTAADLIRQNPRELLRTIAGRPEKYVAYVTHPCKVPAADSVPGWELRKLSDNALTELAAAGGELQAQTVRLAKGRKNDAYGVYVNDTIAGIAWMVPSQHDAEYAVRNVKLRAGEVEITHCVTVSEFRGRGVYTYMIRSLCALACQHQVRRVYMITNQNNTASQRGILKAGLRPTGGIHRHVFDYIGPNVAVTFRRHRWGCFGWQ